MSEVITVPSAGKSGQGVIIQSGAPVSFQSGEWVSTSVSGQPVQLGSGNQVTTVSGSIANVNAGLVDSNNSTTTPLGAGQQFVGTGTEVLNYATVRVSVASDITTPASGLQLQWSQDNVNWDIMESFGFDGSPDHYDSEQRGRYFRVVFTNGAISSTYLRLQTIHCPTFNNFESVRIGDTIDFDEHGQVVKAALFGSGTANVSGEFINVKVNPSGSLTVDATGGSGLFVITNSGIGTIPQSGQGVVINPQSGIGVIISGQGVSLQSGQTFLTQAGSGQVLRTSGQNVIVQSGVNIVGSLSTSISGQPVALVSGTQVGLSGLYINGNFSTTVSSGLYVQVSGQGVLVDKGSLSGLFVSISGQAVSATTTVGSGLYIVMSGQGVTINSGLGIVQASGIGSLISGQGVYVDANSISGQPVQVMPSGGIRSRGIFLATAASGGNTLVSGIVHSVTVKALSGVVFVGGTSGVDMPVTYSGFSGLSGTGLVLGNNEAITLDVQNFNLINVCALNSGDWVSYIGII